jgi:hypothetical protein
MNMLEGVRNDLSPSSIDFEIACLVEKFRVETEEADAGDAAEVVDDDDGCASDKRAASAVAVGADCPDCPNCLRGILAISTGGERAVPPRAASLLLCDRDSCAERRAMASDSLVSHSLTLVPSRSSKKRPTGKRQIGFRKRLIWKNFFFQAEAFASLP